MAVLSDADRAEVRHEFGEEMSRVREACGITKSELRAAVNALDDFLHTNAATINNALPEPAKSTLTTSQKARLLKLVITRRYITGA